MTSYHGGAFFDAIGNEFDSLDETNLRMTEIICRSLC